MEQDANKDESGAEPGGAAPAFEFTPMSAVRRAGKARGQGLAIGRNTLIFIGSATIALVITATLTSIFLRNDLGPRTAASGEPAPAGASRLADAPTLPDARVNEVRPGTEPTRAPQAPRESNRRVETARASQPGPVQERAPAVAQTSVGEVTPQVLVESAPAIDTPETSNLAQSAAEARAALAEADWTAFLTASTADTPEAYGSYLANYPAGRFVAEAREARQALLEQP